MITSGSFWCVLAATVLVYWLLRRGREWWLALASLAYLVFLDLTAAALVVGWSVAFYAAARRRRGAPPGRVGWLDFALIAGLLGCLWYFKYFPAIVHALSEHPQMAADEVLVPLGLSYFTFKLIAYLLDAVRGVLPAHSPRQFMLYMLFFPVFGAGPIERLEPFLANRPGPFRPDVFGEGLTRIAYGLVKKLVIVDILLSRTGAPGGAHFFLWAPPSMQTALAGGSALDAWQFVANRNFSGYVDFSAYSDIAIGCALLFGYRIMENFDWPILAVSIGDFWRRWHMSLSGWCQRYVYMPVVGTTRNPYISIVATMLAIGLWHAGTLNLLVWSVAHAALLCGYQTWGRIRRRRGWTLEHRGFKVLGWAFTMAFVIATSAFTSTNSAGIHAGFRMFLQLFGAELAR